MLVTCVLAPAILLTLVALGTLVFSEGQALAPTPPMGWMTWNFFGTEIHEEALREMADAMVETGMVRSGYTCLHIDDGWQGGRDKRNNTIPDPHKFPSGMKALGDYLHDRGMKFGVYSDAGQLSCEGFTASYGFEEQDAATFASWGADYLKYDYCNAPQDAPTARKRYKAMANALRKTGRDVVFGICCQRRLEPWKWGSDSGGQLWRTGPDSRDRWENMVTAVNCNADLHEYAGPGGWNDMCMLSAGMCGKGRTRWIKGTGCTDVEYRSQMSLWAMMASPLTASCDVRAMDETTRRTLMNTEVIALDQDPAGRQAERKIADDGWDVFVKPLSTGESAVAVLNLAEETRGFEIEFRELGQPGICRIRDLWTHEGMGEASGWRGEVASHETKVFRLRPLAAPIV
jgi:alpha-galactosidase